MADSDRRATILAQATSLFRRLGFAKTSLADVARSAGVSRPTLYSEFSSKTALFDEVIRSLVVETITQIESGMPSEGPLSERLLYACRTWVHSGHVLVVENPDAADLFDPALDAVKASNRSFEVLLCSLLPDRPTAAVAEISSERMSEMISLSLQGFKRFAETPQHLDELIEALVETACLAYSDDDLG